MKNTSSTGKKERYYKYILKKEVVRSVRGGDGDGWRQTVPNDDSVDIYNRPRHHPFGIDVS